MVLVFIDIDGFTRFHPHEQRMIFEQLRDVVLDSKLVKDVWMGRGPRSVPHDENGTRDLCQTTGDGLCLCIASEAVRASATAVFQFCDALLGAEMPGVPPFRMRIGIAGGDGFIVRDHNGNKNVIGSGINVAQLAMSMGEGGHVIVHKSYVELLEKVTKINSADKQIDLGDGRQLRPLGPVAVKHGEEFRVWNYVRRQTDQVIVGRPDLPFRVHQRYLARNRLLSALHWARKVMASFIEDKPERVRARLLWLNTSTKSFVGTEYSAPENLPPTSVEFSADTDPIVGGCHREEVVRWLIDGPATTRRIRDRAQREQDYQAWYLQGGGTLENLLTMEGRPRCIVCFPLVFNSGKGARSSSGKNDESNGHLKINGVLSIDIELPCKKFHDHSARDRLVRKMIAPIQEIVWALLALDLRIGTVPEQPQRDTDTTRNQKSDEVFDVFLAHNSQDRLMARAISKALRDKGLKPWLDGEQIPPGRWFQEVIQQAIRTVKSAAILIGQSGLGRWQAGELRPFIERCLDTKLPVVPVLLPGVPEIPPELVFLSGLSQVKFEQHVNEPEGLNALVWGITGETPEPQ